MAITLEDTFNDDVDTLLANHSPDTGDTDSWEEMGFDVGTATPTVDLLVDDVVYTSESGFGDHGPFHRNSTDPGADEYDVHALFNILTSQTNQGSRYLALGWRMSPTGTANGDVNRYTLLADKASDPNRLELNKVVGGTLTQLADVEVTLSGAHDIRVEVRTDGATVFLDDVEQLSTSDTEITQRGRVGVGLSRADSDQNMDDLSVDSVAAEPITGSGAIISAPAAVDGSGAMTISGSGQPTAPTARLDGVGTVLVSGSGSVTAPAAVVSGRSTPEGLTPGTVGPARQVTADGTVAAPAGIAGGIT